MPISYVGAGAFASGTGAINPLTPAGAASGDFLLMLVESANQAIATPTGNAWNQVANSPQSVGTAAAAGGVRLAVFWRFLTGSDGLNTVADTGDHTTARIFVFRGVDPVAPIDVTVGATKVTGTSTFTLPNITTSATGWVMWAFALDRDASDTTAVTSSLHFVFGANTTNAGLGGGVGLVVKNSDSAPGTYTGPTITGNGNQAFAGLAIGLRQVATQQEFAANVSIDTGAIGDLTTFPLITFDAAVASTASASAALSTFPLSLELLATPVSNSDTLSLTGISVGSALVVAMAFRDGNVTPPTLPTDWTSIATQATAAASARLAWAFGADLPLVAGGSAGITDTQVRVTAYGAGKYVAFTTDTGYWSTDGINFNSYPLPIIRTWNELHYNTVTGLFIAVNINDQDYLTSTDGITWTVRSFSAVSQSVGNIPKLTFAQNGTWLLAGNLATNASHSLDGINWTQTALPGQNGGFVACTGTVFTICEEPFDFRLMYADASNPTVWNQIDLGSTNFTFDSNFDKYASGTDRWIAIDTIGRVRMSTTGTTAVTTNLGVNFTPDACLFFDGEFYIFPKEATNLAYKSRNGTNWKTFTVTDGLRSRKVGPGPGKINIYPTVSVGGQSLVPSATFAGATAIAARIYKNADPVSPIGAVDSATGTGTAITVQPLTLLAPQNRPFVGAFAGHVSPTVTFPTAPSALFNASSTTDATDSAASYDSGGVVT